MANKKAIEKLDLIATPGDYQVKHNWVHGYYGGGYINLKAITKKRAEELAKDPKFRYLEKKKNTKPE